MIWHGDETPRYTLGTVRHQSGKVCAICVDETYFPISASLELSQIAPAGTVRALLDQWSEAEPALALFASACGAGVVQGWPAKAVEVLLPLAFPNKLIGVGGNYASHMEEMREEAEALGVRPSQPELYIFQKPATTTMVGPGPTIVMPKNVERFDWEVELAVVLGSGLRSATQLQASEAIAGYAVAIDLTVRDLLSSKDLFLVFDFLRAKGRDTFCPFGPAIVPARFVSNPQDLRLQIAVNGVAKQDGRTSEMLMSIPEIIAGISQIVTLEPGDVILTGTPAGSGRPGDHLMAGDRLTAEIESVGRLDVSVMIA